MAFPSGIRLERRTYANIFMTRNPMPDVIVLHSNNAGCTWDGGDCCGAKNYAYCKKCKCLDCTYEVKGDACVKDMKKSCGAPKFKGDKYCDG